MLGADPGADTIAYNEELFADESDLRWQRFMASGFAQWSPRFDPDVLS